MSDSTSSSPSHQDPLDLQGALLALTPLRHPLRAASLIAEVGARWSRAHVVECWMLTGRSQAVASHWSYDSFPADSEPSEQGLPPQVLAATVGKIGEAVVLTVPVPVERANVENAQTAVLRFAFDGPLALPSESDLQIFIGQVAAAVANARTIDVFRRASQGWESVFEGMTEGIAIEQNDGRFARVNRALVALLGLDPTEIKGRQRTEVLESLPGYQLVRPLEPVAHSVTELAAQNGEFSFGTPTRTISITLFPLSGTGRPDDPEGAACVLRDISDSQRYQEQSSQSEKLAALGELVSGFAHELNNPLTAVIGYSQLLESDPSLPANLQRPIQTIHSEATRASRIVGNLLAFARHEESTKVALDINSVVRAVVEMRAYQLRAQNTELTVSYGENLPQICGDSHQLQQVLLNIINNAHQAMQAWREGGQVTVTTSFADHRNVRIVIADNGPGIAAEHLQRVFDPFWTTKPLGQGTGLGMSISLRAIADHGGRLWAESQLGRGAQFIIELPAADGERFCEAPQQVAEPATAAENYAQEGPAQILVIDDEEPVVTLITEVLRLDGHQVTPAFNGAEALALLQTRSFDLILSDVRMPAVGGPTFFEILQTTHPQLLPRVIFVTGDTVSPSTQDFLRRAGRPLLSKPFAPDRLREIVNEHVGKGDTPKA